MRHEDTAAEAGAKEAATNTKRERTTSPTVPNGKRIPTPKNQALSVAARARIVKKTRDFSVAATMGTGFGKRPVAAGHVLPVDANAASLQIK